MKLLKSIVESSPDLKKADASDAGTYDVVDKATKDDVGFNLVRNTINSDGEITGSAVANYLERAAELNDEVDTVPFGLETDDGHIVKVYVNAEQAEKFEAEMKTMLGLEDDIEEVINQMAAKFDIVDVVWPEGTEAEGGEDDVELDLEFDPLTGEEDDDEMEEVAKFEPLK
jgi:FAD/FMN-containing dehydrogenase